MAHTNSIAKAQPAGIFETFGKALLWIWDGLVFLGENSARARVVRQINSMSDEQLAARGLTRADVVKRVISDGYHL